MKVAIIGAGWAGLAAALALKLAGVQTTVFEAAPITGGRARRVDDKTMGAIDNGQHLLIGAYTETLALIQRLHPETPADTLLLRLPMQLESADGSFSLRASALPSPMHALGAILGAKGLGLKDKWHAIRMIASLRIKKWQAPPLQTVSQLFSQYSQTQSLCQHLWQPLCLATLNTPVELASAQLFLNVLRDSLDAPTRHSDLIVPRVDLTTLWPEAAAQQLTLRHRHIVKEILVENDCVRIDGEMFEACIVATPPYAVLRMLQCDGHTQQMQALRAALEAFTYRPIATLTLQLEQPWRLPVPILMLDEAPDTGHYGQWLFARKQANQFTVVVSDAEDFLKHDRSAFVDGIVQQIQQQVALHPQAPSDMPKVMAHRLVVEKRATFSAEPGLIRPTNKTAWPRLALAGDWTDTGYPAVLEGAVRSGQQAARHIIDASRAWPETSSGQAASAAGNLQD